MATTALSTKTARLQPEVSTIDAQHREATSYLQAIRKTRNWSITEIARRSHVAPSTLLRLVNDPTVKHTLSFGTIRKVSEGTGVPIPRELMMAHGVTKFEAEQIEAVSTANSDAMGAPTRDLPAQTVRVVQVSPFPDGMMPIIHDVMRLPCPASLRGDTTAFAFSMTDDLLEPIVPQRSILFATKARRVTKGDLALVTDTQGRSFVRIVQDVAADGYALEDSTVRGGILRIQHEDIRDYGVVRVIERP